MPLTIWLLLNILVARLAATSDGFWYFSHAVDQSVVEKDFEKRVLGDHASALLDHFHVVYGDLVLVDEPPCKLRGFMFVGHLNGKEYFVQATLDYTHALFSKEGKWDIMTIRSAKLTRVQVDIIPPAQGPYCCCRKGRTVRDATREITRNCR